MNYDPPRKPTFAVAELGRRHTIDELDVVTLSAEVLTIDGDTVPAGTPGTVVAVWGDMTAFDVEFDEPYASLATVDPALIREHRRVRE